jgi:hypothetical protein
VSAPAPAVPDSLAVSVRAKPGRVAGDGADLLARGDGDRRGAAPPPVGSDQPEPDQQGEDQHRRDQRVQLIARRWQAAEARGQPSARRDVVGGEDTELLAVLQRLLAAIAQRDRATAARQPRVHRQVERVEPGLVGEDPVEVERITAREQPIDEGELALAGRHGSSVAKPVSGGSSNGTSVSRLSPCAGWRPVADWGRPKRIVVASRAPARPTNARSLALL